MPNDAKLGMIVGVGVVLTVAIVFYRKDASANLPLTGEAAAATAVAPLPTPAGTPRGSFRPVRAKTAIQNETAVEVLRSEQRHVVEEGENLFSLAQRYYGDQGKFLAIYQNNRETLAAPDPLTPGIVLVIPKLPEETADPLTGSVSP
jgi:nucleoid-associated protein YgaU